jgi:hypothetical protein
LRAHTLKATQGGEVEAKKKKQTGPGKETKIKKNPKKQRRAGPPTLFAYFFFFLPTLKFQLGST